MRSLIAMLAAAYVLAPYPEDTSYIDTSADDAITMRTEYEEPYDELDRLFAWSNWTSASLDLDFDQCDKALATDDTSTAPITVANHRTVEPSDFLRASRTSDDEDTNAGSGHIG